MENNILEKEEYKFLKTDERLGKRLILLGYGGSYAYGTNIETSDVDTFSFVMPSFEDLAFAREPVSGEFEVEDGKCVYKEIRIALNLLKKTSPNSIEYFLSYYQYHNPNF